MLLSKGEDDDVKEEHCWMTTTTTSSNSYGRAGDMLEGGLRLRR